MSGARLVYLDNHATTRCDPRVLDAMLPYFSEHYGNAGSRSHALGFQARSAVELARKRVASWIGASPKEVVFTSGGTEAINMALLGVVRGIMRTAAPAGGLHVITTVVEHVAVLRTLDHLTQELGIEVTRLPVDAEGRVTASQVVAALRDNTRLVTIMHANNEVQ